jgi:hypothetical protein
MPIAHYERGLAMTTHEDMPPSPEAMGLRREPIARVRVVDALLLIALAISGAVWVWVSVRGVDPGLLAALGSPAGRLTAAVVGLATVAAICRALLLSRWPASENDGSLV